MAVDMFLKLPGVTGEAKDKIHRRCWTRRNSSRMRRHRWQKQNP